MKQKPYNATLFVTSNFFTHSSCVTYMYNYILDVIRTETMICILIPRILEPIYC